jgi:hypothetical protein
MLASQISALIDALNSQRLVQGQGIVLSDTDVGINIAADIPVGFWAKIGATSGDVGWGYKWTEQIPKDGGDWDDGPRDDASGTNVAYESNKNASVPADKIAWLRLAPGSTRFYFTYSACS